MCVWGGGKRGREVEMGSLLVVVVVVVVVVV